MIHHQQINFASNLIYLGLFWAPLSLMTYIPKYEVWSNLFNLSAEEIETGFGPKSIFLSLQELDFPLEI